MTKPVQRVGFLADTHSSRPDGSDLPGEVLTAFASVDMIVHLGDIGRKGILDRLGAVAPVLVPVGNNKGYIPVTGESDPVRTLSGPAGTVGLWFNLAQPDKKIGVAPSALTFPDGPLQPLLQKRFKATVEAVAYGGTHVPHEQVHEGVLFFNPGSPNMPDQGAGGGVAVLDLSGPAPKVTLVPIAG